MHDRGCYAYAMLGKQGQREKETKKKTKTDTKGYYAMRSPQ